MIATDDKIKKDINFRTAICPFFVAMIVPVIVALPFFIFNAEKIMDNSIISDFVTYSGALIFIYIYIKKDRLTSEIYRFQDAGVINIILTIVLTFAVISLIETVSLLLRIDIFFPYYENEIVPLLTSPPLIIQIIMMGIIPPIIEEILFRGVIYSRFKKLLNYKFAVLISSLLFAISHMNVSQGFYAFLIGVFICLIYEKFGTLWFPIMIHMINNLRSIILENLPYEESAEFQESLTTFEFNLAYLIKLLFLTFMIIIPIAHVIYKSDIPVNRKDSAKE